MNTPGKDTFDLVVVGAGFAGLACAKRAAERGLAVLVVDRQPAPGTRVHTTGILVKEAQAEWPAPPSLVRRLDRVRLYAPSLRHVELRADDYYFLATNTPKLMEFLANEARCAGAEVRFGSPFTGASEVRDGTTTLHGVGVTQVGLALHDHRKVDMAAFVERLNSRFGLRGRRIIAKRGGMIPVNGLLRRFHDDPTLLIGDAAGMVSPLTAGGMLPTCRHKSPRLYCQRRIRSRPMSVTIEVSVDEKVNVEAAAVLADAGLSLTSAVRLFLTRVAKERRLPFDPVEHSRSVASPPPHTPNEETIQAIRASENGELVRVGHPADLIAELDSD